MSEKKTLTTASGAPVADNQNSLTAGKRGPILLSDVHLVEKLAHFNRENIPERRVHAKGSAAHGVFTVTQDITQYSCADLFSEVGKKTPIFLRFSTVGGERGSADTVRDPRGFALRFYTQQGNLDIVGNNTPVFFIRDPLKFPDFIHTQKRDPKSNLKPAQFKWDFWSLSPESLHQVTILFSDRGIPDGYRHMHGYGSHTYSLINQDGKRSWIKWHFRTKQGIKNLSPEKANVLAGENPEYSQEDLFTAIKEKNYPKWGVYIQVMSVETAANFKDNPFDVTRVWSQKEFPLIEVGEFELNQNPENYFQDVEQAGFAPSNTVPGVGLSPDRMLQGRVFAYADAQRYRIGTNYQQIPINQPRCPYHNYQRDGAMRFDGNSGDNINYEPNSDAAMPKQTDKREPAFPDYTGGVAYQYNHREDTDYFSQPGALYRLMTEAQKKLLTDNIIDSMQGIDETIQRRQIKQFYEADPDYGYRIAKGLGKLSS